MKKITIILLFVVGNLWMISAQKQWTLEQCLDYAQRENVQIKQRLLQAENAKISDKQSKQNLLPDLNMYVGQGFSFGRSIDETNTYQNNNVQNTSFSVSSGLSLYDGGRMFYAIEKSKIDFQTILQDVAQYKNDVALQVMAYYFQAVYAKQQVKLSEEQQSLTEQQLEKTNLLVESGRLPQGEVYQVQAQLSQDAFALLTARNELTLNLLLLAQLLYVEDVLAFDVVDEIPLAAVPQLTPPLEDIYAKALGFIPAIKAEELRIQSSEESLKMEKAAFYPRLSMGASYGNGYYIAGNRVNLPFAEQWKQNQNLGVSLSLQIPIFNKMSVINRVKQAKLSLEGQRLSVQSAQNDLRKEIQQAYVQTVSSQQKITVSEANVKAKQLAFDYQTEKFESGVSTLYEYNESKNALTRALSEQAQSTYEYLFRSSVLSFYMGEKLF